MKIFARRMTLTLAATALFSVGCGASDEDTQPQVELSEDEKIAADIEALDAKQAAQWDAVKKALNKYKDVNVALAEGYFPVSACEELPGQGVMGIHYMNPALAQDLVSDPFKPELLLYAPDETGTPRLLGPEYFQAAVGQPAPALNGKVFDGPMAGHTPEMPTHFDLHVWLFKYNPSGLFAQWNPNAKCGG
ncbi:MAG TPA: hypothetical protein VF815_32400 [Myxococcaceae bacterium]|jgi:hypothetical protein